MLVDAGSLPHPENIEKYEKVPFHTMILKSGNEWSLTFNHKKIQKVHMKIYICHKYKILAPNHTYVALSAYSSTSETSPGK